MLSLKAVVLAALLSFALNSAGSCDAQKKGNAKGSNQAGNAGAPVNSRPEKQDDDAGKGDLKPLAQGQHSPVRNAFIAVARDAETYGALRKLVPNLPEQDQNFFKSNLIVAAFLGERRTGGYSVRFTLAGAGSLRVEETTPPRDAMVTQVITYPFAMVAVPVDNQEPLALVPGSAWRAVTRPYQVRDGDFTMSGGFAGRSEKFGIEGSLGVMREGNLATFIFNLQSKGGAKPRSLKDAASGQVEAGGRVTIANLSAGSFVDLPADALRATGQFAQNESKLSLTFASIPGQIADGFNGSGTLNAESSAPAPKKNNASGEDNPQ